MSEQEWVHLEVAVIRKETEKAFNVQLEDGSIHWLPKSQISDADERNKRRSKHEEDGHSRF